MLNQSRMICILTALLATVSCSSYASAQDVKPIRIGYAISKTGPYAGGASVTSYGAYQTWIKDVRDAGGITINGKKVPVEVVEYDDRSNVEEMIKAIERLATQDKVDFILPPWGTGFNLAAGPLLNKHGYPHLAVTATTNRAPELAKRWNNSFWFLGTPDEGVDNLIAILAKAKADGKINNMIAMVSVSDQFGIEMATAGRERFKKAGFNIVYDKSYPIGMQDVQPILKEAIGSQADSFIAFSYPPDTLALTDGAKLLNYNPKIFYTAVGTALPIFKGKNGPNTEGVLGIGGINSDSPEFRAYIDRHKAANDNREPDRWANPVTYATLQMLQQAIEKVGSLDRAAVIKELHSTTFDTLVGKVKMDQGLRRNSWQVGQWQGGEYHGIAPASLPGAKQVQLPKPAWKQ